MQKASLFLAETTLADYEDYYQIRCSPMDIYWYGHSGPPDKSSFVDIFSRAISSSPFEKPDDRRIYLVKLLKDNQSLSIGFVQLIMRERGVEIGCSIIEEYQGNGYGSQALRLAVPLAKFHCEDVYLMIRDDNFASQRMARKCNFIPTGEYVMKSLPPHIQTPTSAATPCVSQPSKVRGEVKCRKYILNGEKMLNFTVGPVMSEEYVRAIGVEQVPYFRTPEFSDLMLENESLMKAFVNAGEEARAVFMTGSGTASMEAVVANLFDSNDKLLVVNGGSFGQRFVELCQIYEIPYDEIRLAYGELLTEEHLKLHREKGYTGFLVNVHETSTGVYYDIEMISTFCKANGIFLVVDAISSFLADPFDMTALGVDVVITGSQKALACPPGVSIIVLSTEAITRLEGRSVKCMYLNLKSALKNGERGQTPFTPAVGILRQIHARLKSIQAAGGVMSEIQKTHALAMDFRGKLKGLPLEIFSSSLSNAVTPLRSMNKSASEIFTTLKDTYGIWVCPNGGELADKIFRVGHIGALTPEDNTTLVNALREVLCQS